MTRIWLVMSIMWVAMCLGQTRATWVAKMPSAREYTNSIGMKFVRLEPGEFQMGQIDRPLPSQVLPIFRGRGMFDTLNEGDYDEKPLHGVKITRPFYVGVFEVTNLQYEPPLDDEPELESDPFCPHHDGPEWGFGGCTCGDDE